MHASSSLIRCLAVLILLAALAGCAGTGMSEGPNSMRDWLFALDNPGAEMSYEQHLAMGRTMLEHGDFKEAAFHAAKAGEKRADGTEAILLAADIQRRAGQTQEAMERVSQVLAREPDNAQAHLLAGRIYMAVALDDEAMRHLEKAVRGKDAFEANMLRGMIYDRRQEHAKAAQAFEAALAERPGNAEALNNLGVARMMQDRLPEAVSVFSEATRIAGASARVCNNLGLALARQGRTDEALQAFLCAGTPAQAHNNLGYVLFLKGDYDAALVHLEQAVALSPVFYPQASENLKRARLAAVHSPRPAFSDQAFGRIPESGGQPDKPRNAKPVFVPATLSVESVAAVPAPVIHEKSAQPNAPAILASERTAVLEQSKAVEPAEAAMKGASPTPDETAVLEPAIPAVKVDAVKPVATPGVQAATTSGEAKWALLLSSWKSEEAARAHFESLAAKGVEVELARADLGEKGVWHRVLFGRFATGAQALAAKESSPEGLALGQSVPVRREGVVENSSTSRLAESVKSI